MELLLSLFIFVFGILTWVPFLNGIYGHDQAVAMYFVDRFKKGEANLYKDIPTLPIGYFMHIFFMQLFWEKENTKAFYWIMCLYCSFSSFILFWIILHLFGLFSAVAGSMFFSLYIASPRLDGNWGPSEQLISLPLMISLLCILISFQENSNVLIAFSGIFFGYAILIKQIAVLYFPGYILVMIGTGHSFAYHLVFLGGILITNLIPLVYFSFKNNAFWEYLTAIWLKLLPSAINPKKYNKYYPKNQARGTKKGDIVKKFIYQNSFSLFPLLFLCIVSVGYLFTYHFSLIFAGLFICLLSSIWMIFMRGTFFPHYWLNMVPWLSIFAGFGMSEIITSSIRQGPPTAVSLAGLLAVIFFFMVAIWADRKYYIFSKDPYGFLRRVWGEPFVRKYKNWEHIGKYIKNKTRPEDKILVCGWTPHILMYSDRTHFTPEPCQYTEDYLDIYNRENPAVLDFLNSIYNFKNFKIVKQKENIFHTGYPEVIVFSEGKVNLEGFEQLAGIKYSLDENAGGYPLFRADRELTDLMSFFENKNGVSHEKDNHLSAKQAELNKAIKGDKWNDAFELLKGLLKMKPSNAEYLLLIGDCMINMGKHRLLSNYYKRLIEKHLVPDKVKLDMLNKLSESFCHQNKYSDAEKALQNVLHFDPNNMTALNNLGVVRFNQNRQREAIDYFNKALEIDPNNEDAMANLNAMAQQ